MILGGPPELRRKGYGSQTPTQLGEIRSEGDTRTWMDKQHRMEEAIPPVAPQTVRAAALTVVEKYGNDSGDIGMSARSDGMARSGETDEGVSLRDVLAMLGITRETLTDGLIASGRESAA